MNLGPLNGIRILSVEQYGAGPFGTQFLVEMGAEVIKIEPPEGQGDVSRGVGPHFHPALPKSSSSFFYQSLNAGKKSITLNLQQAEGRAVFQELCRTSHGVTSNLRGDVPGRLGLTYEDLKTFNPAIVCAHLTGYGREGERADWPGYDYLMQAEAGYFSLTGEPNSPPARMGLSMVDYMTGLAMSFGLVSAMMSAQRTKVGCDVDVSLYDLAIYNLNYVGAWMINAGAETTRQPRSAHPALTPCQLYKTRDGWIYLMCNKEKFWRNLCERSERIDLLSRPEFLDYPSRLTNRDLLTNELDATLQTQDTAYWMERFGGAVPASPVLTVGQAIENPYFQTRGMMEEFDVQGAHPIKLMRGPIRTSLGRPPLRAAPVLGADTEEVLKASGFSSSQIALLRSRGTVL